MDEKNRGVYPPQGQNFDPNTGQPIQPAQPQQGTFYQPPQPQQASPQPQHQPAQPQQAPPVQPQQGTYYSPQQYQQPQYQQPQQGVYGQPVQGGYAPTMVAPPKKKSKLPVLIVVIVLIVAIVAAAVVSMNAPEKKFYGTWNSTIDLTDDFIKGTGTFGKYFKGCKFEITYVFNFKDDGTYAITVDKDAFDKTVKELKPYLRKGVIDYFRDSSSYFSKYSDDEIVALYEKSLEKTFDEYIDETFGPSLNYEKFAKSIDCDGKYEVKEDKLFMSAGLNFNVDEKTYYTYEIVSENEINLKEYYKNGIRDSEEPEFKLVKEKTPEK